MTFSVKCPDPTTRWDRTRQRCVPCALRPGHEVTPNCGFDDRGGRHVGPTKPCAEGTFNDGTRPHCSPCASCPPGYAVKSACNATTDTTCSDPGNWTTEVPPQFMSNGVEVTRNINEVPIYTAFWAVPLATIFSLILVLLACFIYVTWKKGQANVLHPSRRSSSGFSPLPALPANSDLEEILSPGVLSAPLQTVLDDLDVLEELQILLDPESQGVKNTKHLASLCSFPFTWITYTYSMKDSKSPLRAVLEGVTSRHPDWTVGNLAKLLGKMERNDAIMVLAKVRLCETGV